MAKDINSKERKESIVIFGYRDTMVGLLIEYMNIDEKYTVEYFISVNPLPNLDIEAEHKNGQIVKQNLWWIIEYMESLYMLALII